MCIAVAKPMGVEMPPESILRTMFINNNDGAGFAFNFNNKVFIKKGYMDIESFIKAINHYAEKYDFKNCGVLIHTRITTHGGTCQEMCHPFPIVADEGALRKIEYVSPYAAIHNGVISLTSSEATRKKSLSDTAIFVQKYLTKIASNKAWFHNPANMELIYDLIDSKMAILNNKGEIVMTNGFTEDNGIYYSNSSYQDSYTRVKKVFDWDCWEEFDNYYEDSYYNNNPDYKWDSTIGGWIYMGGTQSKLTEKNASKYTEKPSKNAIHLTKLAKGECVIFTDGSSESYDEGVDFFLTEDNFVYYTFDTFSNYSFISTKLSYLGIGEIFDSGYRPVAFRKDKWTTDYFLDSSSFVKG